MIKKICTRCGEEKDLTLFYMKTLTSGTKSARSECKKCSNKHSMSWRAKNKERSREIDRNCKRNKNGTAKKPQRPKITISNEIIEKELLLQEKKQMLSCGLKKCTSCKDKFEFSSFYRDTSQCVKCYHIKRRKYDRARYEKYKDVILKRKSVYNKNNRDKINKRKQKRYYSNPQYRIYRVLSSSISSHIKKYGATKGGKSIFDYLSYSKKDLIKHLESQFEFWMNWENYGPYIAESWDDNDQSTWRWNIDHIIPHSTFVYVSMDCEEFRKCWDLSNLRPYSAKQNTLDKDNR